MKNPTIAKRIKQIRIELGYDTQESFAKALGLKKQNIQMYESGSEPKSNFYKSLYKLHNINPLFIMGITDNKYCLNKSSKSPRERATIRYI